MSHKEHYFQYIYIKVYIINIMDVCKKNALCCVHVVNSQMVCRRHIFSQRSLYRHTDPPLAT